MIIVGIIFLSSIGLCSNSSGNLFKYISNIEIVVIDNRSNGYFDIYEPYEQSFPIPRILLDIASGDLNKSGYDEVVCLTSTRQRLNLEYINENGSMHICPIYISIDECSFTTHLGMQCSCLNIYKPKKEER